MTTDNFIDYVLGRTNDNYVRATLQVLDISLDTQLNTDVGKLRNKVTRLSHKLNEFRAELETVDGLVKKELEAKIDAFPHERLSKHNKSLEAAEGRLAQYEHFSPDSELGSRVEQYLEEVNDEGCQETIKKTFSRHFPEVTDLKDIDSLYVPESEESTDPQIITERVESPLVEPVPINHTKIYLAVAVTSLAGFIVPFVSFDHKLHELSEIEKSVKVECNLAYDNKIPLPRTMKEGISSIEGDGMKIYYDEKESRKDVAVFRNQEEQYLTAHRDPSSNSVPILENGELEYRIVFNEGLNPDFYKVTEQKCKLLGNIEAVEKLTDMKVHFQNESGGSFWHKLEGTGEFKTPLKYGKGHFHTKKK